MKILIKYYAKYRDSTGRKEEFIDVPEMTVKDLLSLLRGKYPKLNEDKTSLIALNNRFGKEEAILSDGDIISVFPPVSGG
jgi:molybdopterin synthase sulfur carrier subunit